MVSSIRHSSRTNKKNPFHRPTFDPKRPHTHTHRKQDYSPNIVSLKLVSIARIEDRYASLYPITHKTQRVGQQPIYTRALVKPRKKRRKSEERKGKYARKGRYHRKKEKAAYAGATPLSQASYPLAIPQIPSCLPHCRSLSASKSSLFM
jgi:hypothetical protein